MIKDLKKSSFDPHLNSKFKINAEGVGSIEAELVEIEETHSDQVEGFSVVFRGPKEPVLPHDTLKIKHVKMGEFDLFIGPIVHEKQDGVYYQAVFNRLKEK